MNVSICYIPIFYETKENMLYERHLFYFLVLSNQEFHQAQAYSIQEQFDRNIGQC